MVLHLKEFAEKHCSLGQTLNYYDELPQYLHEMPVEEIIKQISRNGEKGAYNQKRAVLKYLEWLPAYFSHIGMPPFLCLVIFFTGIATPRRVVIARAISTTTMISIGIRI